MTTSRSVNWTAVEAGAAVLGVLLAIASVVYAGVQLNGVRNSLRSAGSQAAFTQQLEVNRLFLEEDGDELIPYFFHGQQVPPDLEARATVVAGSVLDFFSNLEDQQIAGSFHIDDGWSAYIRESFANSPVLCDTLVQSKTQYGGEDGFLWQEYARDACS